MAGRVSENKDNVETALARQVKGMVEAAAYQEMSMDERVAKMRSDTNRDEEQDRNDLEIIFDSLNAGITFKDLENLDVQKKTREAVGSDVKYGPDISDFGQLMESFDLTGRTKDLMTKLVIKLDDFVENESKTLSGGKSKFGLTEHEISKAKELIGYIKLGLKEEFGVNLDKGQPENKSYEELRNKAREAEQASQQEPAPDSGPKIKGPGQRGDGD